MLMDTAVTFWSSKYVFAYSVRVWHFTTIYICLVFQVFISVSIYSFKPEMGVS